jgi:hypothetical protein
MPAAPRLIEHLKEKVDVHLRSTKNLSGSDVKLNLQERFEEEAKSKDGKSSHGQQKMEKVLCIEYAPKEEDEEKPEEKKRGRRKSANDKAVAKENPKDYVRLVEITDVKAKDYYVQLQGCNVLSVVVNGAYALNFTFPPMLKGMLGAMASGRSMSPSCRPSQLKSTRKKMGASCSS